MKNRILSLILSALVLPMMFGCSKADSAENNMNAVNAAKKTKTVKAAEICGLLADPVFEKRQEYDGSDCRGETHFGAKLPAGTASKDDHRPYFSLYAANAAGNITMVKLSIANRDDEAGRAFFMTETRTVGLLINNQPLSKEIEEAIVAPFVKKDDKAYVDKKFQWNNAQVSVTKWSSMTTVDFMLQ